MAETNINYVSKREFRVVSLILVPIIVVLLATILPRLRSLLLGSSGATNTRSTPIVVRGGAMTAFSEHSKWTKVSPSTYCLDIKKIGDFYVNFDDMADGSSGSWTAPKAVEIHGHVPTDPNATQASKSGLRLVLQTTNCAGASGHESVQISAVGGGFYPLAMPQHGSHGGNLRFQIDSSAGCAQDQDICERMAELVVTDSSGTVLSPIPCPDGDCSISIGVQ